MSMQLTTPPAAPPARTAAPAAPVHRQNRAPREEVNEVAIFESRQGRGKRAWDEMSEIDRMVLLESVRQRRKAEAQKHKIQSEIYNLRANR